MYFHVIMIFLQMDGNLSGTDGFNIWSAAYLGDLCLIASTVIWSSGCAVIGISEALLFLSSEVHLIICFPERVSCGPIWDIIS